MAGDVKLLMATLSYNEPKVLEEAWNFIERGETVEIILAGWRGKIIRKVFPHYLASLAPDRTFYQRRVALAKLVCFGAFCAPTLWAICNRAIQLRMPLSGTSVNDLFIVTCKSMTPED